MTVDVTAIFLAVSFVFVSCLGLNQLYRVAISKHYKYSLRAGILLFLTLGAIIRVLFWIKVATPTAWPNQIMALIFFVPVWMQFVGYSLLSVFYAAALSDTRSRGPLQYAIVVNTLLLVICVTISFLMKDPSATTNSKVAIEIVYFSFKALLDVILVVLLSYFGYRFGVKQSSHKTVATRILPRSPQLFSYVNWVLVGTSALRAAFNVFLITAIKRSHRTQMLYYHSDNDREMTPSYLAPYFFAVECIPSICIFVTLWKRPPAKSKNKKAAPPTTAAERAVANSIDEKTGVVVRHFGNGNDASRPVAPVWWNNFITNTMLPESGSFRGSDGPMVNEDASDDDYMMFRGVVHPGSATGDAVQISTITRNQLHATSSPPTDAGTSLESSRPPTAPYLTNNGGLPPIQVPHKFSQGSVSPMISGTGTPPSFDTWMKQQRGSSDPALSSMAGPGSRSSGQLDAQGSPVLTTPYVLSSERPPSSGVHPPSCASSHTLSDSGTFVGYWNSDSDVRTSNQMSATSGCRPSESSVDSQIDPESQVEGNGFDDYLSPRDILLAQQKKSMKR